MTEDDRDPPKLVQFVPKDKRKGPLDEHDIGDIEMPPPRGWLLGNVFCRGFHSSLIGAGGVGKTALRYAQYIALASGRPITGEHIFERARVLILSFEDSLDELKRRLLAVLIHHGVGIEEVAGWLFYAAPSWEAGKLALLDQGGNVTVGGLAGSIKSAVVMRDIDLVGIDPFVKSHGVDENSNSQMDAVMEILTDIAVEHDIATDAPAHVRKGNAVAGNAEAGRGASAQKDAGRLVYTVTSMAKEEAEVLGISEDKRKGLLRVDSAKVNIAVDPGKARWFELVSVSLGNASELYPKGDSVQTVRPYILKGALDQISIPVINTILDDIQAGMPDGGRYSSNNAAGERAVWPVIQKHVPELEASACRQIIKRWEKSGLLFDGPFDNPKAKGKKAWGLFVQDSKRPPGGSETR